MKLLFLIILTSGLLAGTCKAIRDNVDNRFNRSIFRKIKNKKIREWFESDWTKKPNHPFAPFWDAWHCFDFFSYFLLLMPVCFLLSFWMAILMQSIMLIIFTALYHYFLLDKEDRDLKELLTKYWNWLKRTITISHSVKCEFEKYNKHNRHRGEL